MAVITAPAGDMNGFDDTYTAHIQSHEENSRILLNLSEGRQKNASRPPYDPKAAVNRWPLMVHHPAHGEKTIGSSIVGKDHAEQLRLGLQYEKELKIALASGYQYEPFVKPQIAVLSPEIEKQRLQDQNRELQGQLVMLMDITRRQQEQLNLIEKNMAHNIVAAAEKAASKSGA